MDLERLRPDRQTNGGDKGRFEGYLTAGVTTLPVNTLHEGISVTPASTPDVNPPRATEALIEQLATQVSECGAEMSLHWDTPELGSLQIEIRRDGERVEVTIVADTEGATELLQQHVSLLRDLLAEEDLQLARYNVLHGVIRRHEIDSERNDSEAEISSLLGVIRGVSSS